MKRPRGVGGVCLAGAALACVGVALFSYTTRHTTTPPPCARLANVRVFSHCGASGAPGESAVVTEARVGACVE